MATAAPVEEPGERECTICHEPFTVPKILPCGHLLCRHCLISWLQTESDADCPLCRHPIVQGQLSSPETDVADSFPTHSFMAAITEAERLLSEQHVCCVCVNMAAVSLCVNCGDMFCQGCSTLHKKQSATRHHQVETLASLTADTLAAKRPVTCPVHPSEVAQMFCSTHSVPVCFVCASTDHRQCPHMVKAENSAQESHNLLKQVAATLKTGEQKLDRALEEIEEFLQNLARQTDAGVAEIKAVQQRLEKAVQACCSRMMEEALQRSSEIQTKVLGQKAELKKERVRMATHSHIADQMQSFLHRDLSDMAEKMKKRADTFDCGAGVLASVKENQGLTVTIEAVKRIEQELWIMGIIELHFRANHGKRVRLSNGGQTAERTDRYAEDGVVVSRDAMVVNRLYEVNVDAINTGMSITCLGVVTGNPDTLSLPYSAIESVSTQVLCVRSDYGRAFGQKLEKEWPCLLYIAEGTRLGLALDQDRSLHLYVQGQDKGVITSDIPQPCYFMFELYSRCEKVAWTCLCCQPCAPACEMESSLLPSAFPKSTVYHYQVYKRSAAESDTRAVGSSTFRKLWQQLCPFIVVARPMTNLCWRCQQNNTNIFRSANLTLEEKTDHPATAVPPE